MDKIKSDLSGHMVLRFDGIQEQEGKWYVIYWLEDGHRYASGLSTVEEAESAKTYIENNINVKL